MSEHESIDFMLRRTAALLLTDVRMSAVDIGSADVGIQSGDDDTSAMVPYAPLLLGLHALRMWPRFQSEVLVVLKRLCAERKLRVSRPNPAGVDWSKTIEQMAVEPDSSLVFGPRDDLAWLRNESVGAIVCEYRFHVSLLLTSIPELPGKEGLAELLLRLQSIADTLASECVRDDVADALDELETRDWSIVEDTYRALVDPKDPAVGSWAEYEAAVKPVLRLDNQHWVDAKPAHGWRTDYLRMSTGLGMGKDLLVEGTTDAAHLYEMWCFFELINALHREFGVNVGQNDLITGSRDLEIFSMSDIGKAYYNYQGKGSDLQRFLVRACVEWFLVLDDGRRVVLDTKYARWNSKDNAQVLGYMMTFSAEVGVVLFAKSFDATAYGGAKGELFAEGDVRGGKFIAAHVRPVARHQKNNLVVFRRICEVLKEGRSS